MSDLYHHAQHLYSMIIRHTANCCGRYKLIWTVSCISHNISHPPCCKLAQVVALCSPPFNVKLSLWLLSSCNAAPLIAKVTTPLKEVAFHQPIRWYQILCSYWVSRPCLLNEQRLRGLDQLQRHRLGAMSDSPNNQPVTFGSELGIYSHLVFSSLTEA
jgi:hypothetical protein